MIATIAMSARMRAYSAKALAFSSLLIFEEIERRDRRKSFPPFREDYDASWPP